jgi:hypothetical protein
LAVVWVAVPCSAGTMSFSVYTDYASGSNAMKLYMYATTADNSTGCTHSGYTITANIYSPTNRHAATQSAGLQGSTSIDVLEDTGIYNLVTTGTYICSCMNYQTVGYGGNAVGVNTGIAFGRYQKAPNNTGCSLLLTRYNAFQCSVMCMQPFRCAPYTSKWVEWRTLILNGACQVGYPWPYDDPDFPQCRVKGY